MIEVIFTLEGPDLAGKSTLADELEKQFLEHNVAVTRMKRGPLKPNQDPLTEYLVPLQDYDGNGAWILDRWHLGELIYGPILRGASRLSIAQALYIELAMRSLNARQVHVTAPQEILSRRYASRGDDLIELEVLLTIRQHYYEAIGAFFPWYWAINTDMHSAATYAVNLTTIQVTGPTVPHLRWTQGTLPAEYLGGPRPKVLLLGDRQAAGSATLKRPAVVWPFAPWNGTSGHWLFNAMLAAGVKIYDVGIINACDRHPSRLNAVWQALGQPPVITLGLNSRKSTEAAQVPIANHIPHPQFARRFHHRDLVPYGLEIKKVMA